MPEKLFPRVRFDDPEISVRELAGELVVYDATRDKAHALSLTVASVWRLCDGRTPLAEMAEALADEYDLPPEDARSILLMSLQRLENARLLSERWQSGEQHIPTRREALQTAAGVGMAALLPVVYSMLAPGSAQAQSVVNCVGDPCHISQGQFCGPGCRCSKPRGSGVCLRA